MQDEALIRGLIEAVSEVMKDMRNREDELYWEGQLSAWLDSADIDINELVENKKLTYFTREN